ncbi:MAG: AEC family transporter [Clostridia bacterium]|nr:AEC family transporter [Clostridia bacterium]
MSVFSTMAGTQMLMFLYLLVGAVSSKTGIIREEAREGMLSFLIYVVMPASILSSFVGGLERQQLLEGLQAMLICTAACLLSWGLGALLWRKSPDGRRQVLIFGTVLPNIGNAGLPISQLVFGPMGVFYTSMQMIPGTILGWTIGPAIYGQARQKGMLKRFLTNPNIVAAFLGIFLTLTGIRLPSVIGRAITGITAMTAPLSMALIGAALTQVKPRSILRRDVVLFCLVRLILIPLLMLPVLRLLGVGTMLWQVSIVLFAMPVANYVAIQGEMYGGDHIFASALIFITTLLSLVTVPLVTLLF